MVIYKIVNLAIAHVGKERHPVEQSRREPVYIFVDGWPYVEIAWAERDWLLEKIRVVAGFETIVADFTVGAPHYAIVLDLDQQARLRAALEAWERELTDGLVRLLDALVQAAPRSEA